MRIVLLGSYGHLVRDVAAEPVDTPRNPDRRESEVPALSDPTALLGMVKHLAAAKWMMPCKLRQQPPEVRCCSLIGRLRVHAREMPILA